MPSDIEIAQKAQLKKISEIASELGLVENSVELYGRFKAKIDTRLNPHLQQNDDNGGSGRRP